MNTILRATLVVVVTALTACSAPATVEKTATTKTDYAPLMAYVGMTCTGHIGSGTNTDSYSLDGPAVLVDHAYSLKTGLVQTGGMYHTHGLSLAATGNKDWPYQFTSPVSGSVQMLSPAPGAKTLNMRVNANGAWYTATYACKKS